VVRVERVETWEFPLTTPSNFYVVSAGGAVYLVDTGARRLPDKLARMVDGVILTHWHWDHTYGVSGLRSKMVCASPTTLKKLEYNNVRRSVYRVVEAMGLTERDDADVSFLETMISRYKSIITGLAENDVYTLDECRLTGIEAQILECPGHSDDHVCPVIGGYLFAGDTLTPGESPTTIDFNAYTDTLVRIFGVGGWKVLAPGHGPLVGRDDALNYAIGVLQRKRKKMYKLLARLSGEWVGFNELLRMLYGLEPSLSAYVAARTLIGYLRAAEEAGVVEVDRSVRPWRVRALA